MDRAQDRFLNAEARTLLVTGGSRGIGAAIARLAGERGYDVVLTYRRAADEARAVCEAIAAHGRRALAIQADLAVAGDVERLWRETLAEVARVDVLVNNAGMLEQQRPLAEIDAARMSRVFAVNAVGPMLCAAQAVRHMSTARGGAGGVIVNVSSIAARLGAPGEYIDYAAAKAAIDTLTVGLAKEVGGEGIRVAGVRPGTIATGIHADGGEPDRVQRIAKRVPLGRGGEPGEVAEAVLWLASPAASYVSGAVLEVGGGL